MNREQRFFLEHLESPWKNYFYHVTGVVSGFLIGYEVPFGLLISMFLLAITLWMIQYKVRE